MSIRIAPPGAAEQEDEKNDDDPSNAPSTDSPDQANGTSRVLAKANDDAKKAKLESVLNTLRGGTTVDLAPEATSVAAPPRRAALMTDGATLSRQRQPTLVSTTI